VESSVKLLTYKGRASTGTNLGKSFRCFLITVSSVLPEE